MEVETILGYLSGLYFVRPDLEASSLFRTAFVIHVIDAVLCRLIATQNRRNKNFWALFLLPGRKQKK